MSQESTTALAAAASDLLRPAPTQEVDEAASWVHPLAGAHQALGNNAVLHQLARPAVQPRLQVGGPDDPQEREADDIAAALVHHPEETDHPHPGEHSLRRSVDEKKRGDAAGPMPPASKPAASTPAPGPAAPTSAPGKDQQPAAGAPPAPYAAKDQPKDAAAEAPKPKDDAVAPPGAAAPGAAEKAAPGGAVAGPKAVSTGKVDPEPGAAKPKESQAPGAEQAAEREAAPGGKGKSGVPEVTPEVEQVIAEERGGGQPLPAGLLEQFESRLGRDLGAVRIHDSARAGKAAQAIQARAFTYGQDIFFAPGLYQPHSPSGRELIAHELAHTVQQRAAPIVERQVRRQPTAAPASQGATAGAAAATHNTTKLIINLPSVDVPQWRTKQTAYASGTFTRKRNFTRDMADDGDADHREIWITATTPALTTKLQAFVNKIGATSVGGSYSLDAVGEGRAKRTLDGDLATLAAKLTTPDWGRSGAMHGRGSTGFHVDHILELQLGGANKLTNMELLDASVNSSSGSFIRGAIKRAVAEYISKPDPKGVGAPPTLSNWKTYEVNFKAVKGSGTPKQAGSDDRWRKEEIMEGGHLLEKVLRDRTQKATPGSATSAEIRVADGPVLTVNPQGPAGAITLFKPFNVVAQEWNVGDDWAGKPLATFTLELPEESRVEVPNTPPAIAIERVKGERYVGKLGSKATADLLVAATLKEMSALKVKSISAQEDGLQVDATISASVPIIKGASVDITLAGGRLTLSKTFDTGDFKLPPPFNVTQSSLTVSARDDGAITVGGRVDAEIDKLGEGHLEAATGTRGWSLAGGFKFNTELFDSAKADFRYDGETGTYSASGQLVVTAGKVAGVRKASLDVGYKDNVFVADGSAEFSLPAIESGRVNLKIDPAAGAVLEANVKLRKMTGISSGQLDLTVAQAAGGGGYELSGGGTVQSDIKEIATATVGVDFRNGMFVAKATVDFEKGRIKGTLSAGATNRPVDEKGTPLPGGSSDDPVTIFGYGTATLRLTPWLSGSAGIRLLPNGELVFSGDITLDPVALYPAKEMVPKQLAKVPPLTFPLIGPVFATLSAELNLKAGVGAGMISGKIAVEAYNPDREADTKLTSQLSLQASAYAGLELTTSVGVGAGVKAAGLDVASVTGQITLGGELRLPVTQRLDVPLTWMPSGGVVVDATLALTFKPKLIMTLKAEIVAVVIGLYRKKWPKDLAGAEYGSGLEFGVSMPFHYEDGKPFDVDFSQATISYPELDPIGTARGFLSKAFS